MIGLSLSVTPSELGVALGIAFTDRLGTVANAIIANRIKTMRLTGCPPISSMRVQPKLLALVAFLACATMENDRPSSSCLTKGNSKGVPRFPVWNEFGRIVLVPALQQFLSREFMLARRGGRKRMRCCVRRVAGVAGRTIRSFPR
jgi:hypothetical protein